MASGSWEFGTSNGYIIGMVQWSSSSNGPSANSSNVNVNVYFRRTNSYAVSYGTINTTVICDNGSYAENGLSISLSTGWVLANARSYTVPHNADGSKLCHIRTYGNANFSLGSFDTSSNVWLDHIPRYTSVTAWETTEIGQTYAKFRWATADTVDFARVYLNNSSQHTDIPGSVNSTSGSFTYTGMASSGTAIPSVSTLSPGTTYNLKIQVRRKDSQLWTTSNNVTFTTMPIATISNTSIDFNIGSNLVLNFNNHLNNKTYLALDVQKIDGTWEENIATVGETLQVESYTWNLSSIASTLYSKVPTRNSANIRIRYGTTINDVKYEGSINGTMNVVASDPTFSTYSFGNAEPISAGLLGTSYMPENIGDMQSHISTANKAVAKNGASIIKYISTVTDSENAIRAQREVAYSSSAQVNMSYGNFSTAGTYTINIQAVDSRNNVSPIVRKTFTVLPYHIPQTVIKMERVNNYDEEITIDLSSKYSKLAIGSTNKNNSFVIKYRYCEAGGTMPTTFTAVSGLTSSSFSTTDMKATFIKTSSSPFLRLSSNKTYNFEFSVTDKIVSVTEKITVSQGIPIFFEGDNGMVSVGKVPDWNSPAKFQTATDILATDSKGNKRLVLGEIDRINNDLSENIKDTTTNINNTITTINNTIDELNSKLASWETYRESFIGTHPYRLTFGTVQAGIIETNQVSIPWLPSEVYVSLVKINIPGQGIVVNDYKYAYLTDQGGLYVYCSKSGALGVNDLLHKVVDVDIRITRK